MARHKRLKPGGQISASATNALQRSVEQLQKTQGVSGLVQGNVPVMTPAGLQIPDSIYKPFYARITAHGRPAWTRLRASVNPLDEEFLVVPVENWFLAPPYWMIVEGETVQVIEHLDGIAGVKPGFHWKVKRGMAGTEAASHDAGVIVQSVWVPYAFVEVHKASFGIWVDHEAGRASTFTENDIVIPAFETKGVQRVPIDGTAIVQLWAGYDGSGPSTSYYLFEYWPVGDGGGEVAIQYGIAAVPFRTLSASSSTDPPEGIVRTQRDVRLDSCNCKITVQDDRYCVKLCASIGAADTEILTTGTAQFPGSNSFYALIEDEVVQVLTVQQVRSGKDQLLVARAQAGTKAAAHAALAQVCWIEAVTTTLAAPLGVDATSMTLASKAGLPTDRRFLARVGKEIVLALGGTGACTGTETPNTLEVQRAREGTEAVEHPSGTAVVYLTPDLARASKLIFTDNSFTSPGAHPGEAVYHEPAQLVRIATGNNEADDKGFLVGYVQKWDPVTNTFQDADWVHICDPNDMGSGSGG